MPATAAGLTELIARLSSAEGLHDPFERVDDRLSAHGVAVAGKVLRFASHPVGRCPGKADHPHRLLAAAAARARDAGDREGDRPLAARKRPPRHLARSLLAYRAVLFQGGRPDPEQLPLGSVRVSDIAALEPPGRSRDRGHRLRHPPARARFGRHEHPARRLQALAEPFRKIVHYGKKRRFPAASTSTVYPAATRSSNIT